jgi:hypothetical protein
VSLGRPRQSCQHLQNCCLATKTSLWIGVYLHSAVCSKCEVASQIGSGIVRFTLCCKLLSNDGARSSGQFRKLCWKHKLIFTGLDWIAGPLVPPSKCIIASSSKSQVTMPSKPTYMHVHVSLTPCFPQKIVSNDPKQSDELG